MMMLQIMAYYPFPRIAHKVMKYLVVLTVSDENLHGDTSQHGLPNYRNTMGSGYFSGNLFKKKRYSQLYPPLENNKSFF